MQTHVAGVLHADPDRPLRQATALCQPEFFTLTAGDTCQVALAKVIMAT